VTQVAGAGAAGALLSPAANAYLSAANTVAQDVSSAIYNVKNNNTTLAHLNMAQTVPGSTGPDRAITFRFRDTKGKALFGVRILVSFTRTLAKQDDNIDPTSDTATQPPQFTGLPDILSVAVGAPATGSQTLLQEISKDSTFQSLITSGSNTDADAFKKSCDALERSLLTTYGLNRYDTSLAMAEILNEYTLYYSLVL